MDAFTPVFARFTGHRLPDLYVAVDHRSDMFYENVNGHFRQASLPHGVAHAARLRRQVRLAEQVTGQGDAVALAPFSDGVGEGDGEALGGVIVIAIANDR